MKTIASYCKKAIAALFWLLIVVYSQYGYAGNIRTVQYQEDGQTYLEITFADNVSVVTHEIAQEIVSALEGGVQDMPVGRLVLGNQLVFKEGTLKNIAGKLNDMQHRGDLKLKELEVYCAKGNIYDLVAIAHFLKNNKTVKIFTLSYSGEINEEVSKQVAQIIIGVLQKNDTLTTLCLHGNLINRDRMQSVIAALKTCKNITRLELTGNDDSKVLQDIAEAVSNDVVSLVELTFNRVTDDVAIVLARALEKNTKLVSIKLRGGINDKGAKALARALLVNRTLQHLNLAFNFIDNEGMEELARAIRVNTTLCHLDITDNNNMHDGDVYIGFPEAQRGGLEALLEGWFDNLVIQVRADWLEDQNKVAKLLAERNRLVTELIRSMASNERVRRLNITNFPGVIRSIIHGSDELRAYLALNDINVVDRLRVLQATVAIINAGRGRSVVAEVPAVQFRNATTTVVQPNTAAFEVPLLLNSLPVRATIGGIS